MMWGYTGTWSWGGMLWMGVSMLFGIALLVGIVYVVVRGLSQSTTAGTTAGVTTPITALQTLEQRYARGEIDEATFQRMRDHLRTPPSH